MDRIFPTAIRALAVLTITLIAAVSPPARGASVADCDDCPEWAEAICVVECLDNNPCVDAKAVPVRCMHCYIAKCTDVVCPVDNDPDLGERALCVLDVPDSAPW